MFRAKSSTSNRPMWLKTKNSKTRVFSGLTAVVVLLALGAIPANASNDNSSTSLAPVIPDIPCCGGGGPVWGIDSVNTVNSTWLPQITSQLGAPVIVGQYLDTGSGQHLTSSQASYIHGQGISIFLLYSPLNASLVGSTAANSDAAKAVSEAKTAGAQPNSGIAIYRDVEEAYSVNSAYVNAWYTAITDAGYIPAFYENSFAGQFESAFCGAGSSTISGTYLYASELHSGSSYLEIHAPATYNPYYVACESFSQMSGWQYLTGGAVSGHSIDVDEYAQVGLY